MNSQNIFITREANLMSIAIAVEGFLDLPLTGKVGTNIVPVEISIDENNGFILQGSKEITTESIVLIESKAMEAINDDRLRVALIAWLLTQSYTAVVIGLPEEEYKSVRAYSFFSERLNVITGTKVTQDFIATYYTKLKAVKLKEQNKD